MKSLQIFTAHWSKEDMDMEVLKSILGFIGGLLLAIGKLGWFLVKSVFSLSLLFLQLVLIILHVGSD